MKNHSKSLFISILIHLLLLGIFLFVYTISSKVLQTSQEKKVCIQLNSLQEEQQQKTKKVLSKQSVIKNVKQTKKQVEKKVQVHKKKTKKTSVKKILKKELCQHKQVEKKSLKKAYKKKEPKTSTQPLTKQAKSNAAKKPIVQKQETSENIYIKNNLDKIATLIHDNLYYPRRARKRGIEGVVVVRFHLDTDGSVKSANTISSQQDILSRAALKTINELSGQFPKPAEALILTVPIHYQLD